MAGKSKGSRKNGDMRITSSKSGGDGFRATLHAAGKATIAVSEVIRDAGAAGATVHPFDTDPADHCETPREAYEHLAPFLKQLAKHLRKAPADLVVYDPYFCEGSMRRHLQKLGYLSVYNKNEDFYSVIREGRVPDYDILVTSPPYSRDHMQKLASFCAASGKPWALLLPSFVHRKQYWQQTFPDTRMVWVVPEKRYHYWSICGGRKHNLQICRHWARDGRCMYKDSCAFLHSSGPLEGSKGPDMDRAAKEKGGAPGCLSAPADVAAGSTAPQNVSPHLLSPYNSLWHIHLPEKPSKAACGCWSVDGATLAQSRNELTAHLRAAGGKNENGNAGLTTGKGIAATVGSTAVAEEGRAGPSLEEARQAERERVARKRQAAQESQARRQRAAIARQLEVQQLPEPM